DASFQVDTVAVNNQNVPIGTPGSFTVNVPEGTCLKVARSPDLPGGITTFKRVTATELPAPNVQLDSIFVEHFGIKPAPIVPTDTVKGTSTITRVINGDIGYVTHWFNS